MTDAYGYEIDFLPVGDGEASGDAIGVRYGYANAYSVIVVDGGTVDSGKAFVDHINKYYDTPSRIDHVVCTHPDDDHSSGLREVIKAFEIKAIWIHRPWLYADRLVDRFKGNWTVQGLRKRLRDDFPIIAEISDYAEEHDIPIYEPFQGAEIGDLRVMSPTFEAYLNLVPQFDRTPDAAESAPQKAVLEVLGEVAKVAKKIIKWISETWFEETLKEGSETSATNESSVVLYGDFEGRRVLLTADAGIQALTATCDHAEQVDIPLQSFRFVQVPHHGSRHNVSPSVLNRLIGPIVDEGETINTTAIASAAEKSETHPRRVVLNAFRRRGVKVSATNGSAKRHSLNMPDRAGWVAVTPYEFLPEVEGD